MKGRPSLTLDELCRWLQTAGNPTRLQLLLLLAERSRNVLELAEVVSNVEMSAVSNNLVIMRFGGIVEAHRSGANRIYSLTETGRDLVKVIDRLWEVRPT